MGAERRQGARKVIPLQGEYRRSRFVGCRNRKGSCHVLECDHDTNVEASRKGLAVAGGLIDRFTTKQKLERCKLGRQ